MHIHQEKSLDVDGIQGCHSGQVGACIFFYYHAPYGRQARIFGFVLKKYAPEALQARFFFYAG